MFNTRQTAPLYHWVGCCLLVCTLGCGSKPDATIPDSASGDATSAQGDDSKLTELARPNEDASAPSSVAKLPSALPADDRYATGRITETKVVEVKPWTGPRPELPVYPMTVEQFNAAWEIDLDVVEQPLAKVIEQIVAEVPLWQPQLQVATDEENAGAAVVLSGALEKPISLKLSQVSRLEAIERACEAAGVYPEYAFEREFADSKPTIRLHTGPRSRKFGRAEANPASQLVAFVGPQMIELTRVNEYPPYAVGSLELRRLSLPLPAPVRNLQEGPACTFERVLLADGRDVHAGHGGATHVIVPTILDVRNDRLQLKDLLRDVTQLAEVQGDVKLPIPLKTSVAWLDSLAEGYKTQTDELSVTLLTNSVSYGSWYLRYEVFSAGSLEGLVAFAFDTNGELIETDSFGTSWAPGFNQGTGSLNLAREPRMLAVVVIDKQTAFASKFSLKHIPLARSAEQPAELPSLTFDGFDHPLTIGAGELKRDAIFKEVELTMTNYSNKDIREIELTMHYLDAQGNKLRDNPTSMAAKYDNAHEPYPILVKAGATTKRVQTAYLCPDETKQVTLTVSSILFADLERWTAQSPR